MNDKRPYLNKSGKLDFADTVNAELTYEVIVSFQGTPYFPYAENCGTSFHNRGFNKKILIDAVSLDKAHEIGKNLYNNIKPVVEQLYHLTENNDIQNDLVVTKV